MAGRRSPSRLLMHWFRDTRMVHGSGLFRVLVRVLAALGAVVLLLSLLVLALAFWLDHAPTKPVLLGGTSMLPTLATGDIVYYRESHDIHRGDIRPVNKSLHRVVLMPGETFRVEHGRITIEDPGPPHVLLEPYVVYNYDWNWPKTTLGPDEYAELGDNRTNPASRYPSIATATDLGMIVDRRIFPFGKRKTF